jgi:DNA-binding MarR family transcriptional regulator
MNARVAPIASNGPDHDRDALVTAVEHEIVALATRLRAGTPLAAHDIHERLTVGAYRILLRVTEEHEARITDLACYFEVGKPTMSRQVAALEQLGLVQRRPDPDDGRGALVSLTGAGRAAFDRARTRRHQWIDSLLADFSDAEAHTFAELLRRFVQHRGDAAR